MQLFTFDFQTLWVRSKTKDLNNTLQLVFLALETSKFCINQKEERGEENQIGNKENLVSF